MFVHLSIDQLNIALHQVAAVAAAISAAVVVVAVAAVAAATLTVERRAWKESQ